MRHHQSAISILSATIGRLIEHDKICLFSIFRSLDDLWFGRISECAGKRQALLALICATALPPTLISIWPTFMWIGTLICLLWRQPKP